MLSVQYEFVGKALLLVAEQGKDVSDSVKLLLEKLSESAEKSAESV